MSLRRRWMGAVLALAGLACGPGSTPPAGAGSTSTTTDDSTGPTATITATEQGSATSTPETSSDSGEPSTDDTGPADSTGSTGGGCDPLAPVECAGWNWECSNGIDDDGDGLFDLDDPNCISACDDSEDALSQSIPGDNVDCFHDCAFDANTGLGDDGCWWTPHCDPLSPRDSHCPYDPATPECSEGLPEVPRQCLDACEPLVPNGCDCFGCCTFQTETGPVDVLVNDTVLDTCSVENLEGCPACTKQDDVCGNPCEPEACEVCIGELQPPNACESVGCVGATACEDRCDCAEGEVCITGCCMPLPPN